MNFYGVLAIYRFEMSRTRRTLIQSIVAPVITTSLYFIVFGAAIGSRIQEVGGVSYGAFIVPGLIMLNLLTNSISNGSFGIYFPKFVGTVYEILSAPVSTLRDCPRLCGCCSQQSPAARIHYPAYCIAVYRAANCPSAHHAGIFDTDGDLLQPPWVLFWESGPIILRSCQWFQHW